MLCQRNKGHGKAEETRQGGRDTARRKRRSRAEEPRHSRGKPDG
nr:MAG TPA: hypothetical protein [Caudoviricetes sp.]